MNKKYLVIDTETGGMTPDHAILTIAAVSLDENLSITNRKYNYILDHLDKLVEQDALNVNGLTLEAVKASGVPIETFITYIQDEIDDGAIIVCHNAAFDMKMLNARGLDVQEAVDTMLLSWHVWPRQKAKLGIVLERIGYTPEGLHNALGDVYSTIILLKYFKENPDQLFPLQGIDPLKPRKINFELDYKLAYMGIGLPYNG